MQGIMNPSRLKYISFEIIFISRLPDKHFWQRLCKILKCFDNFVVKDCCHVLGEIWEYLDKDKGEVLNIKI